MVNAALIVALLSKVCICDHQHFRNAFKFLNALIAVNDKSQNLLLPCRVVRLRQSSARRTFLRETSCPFCPIECADLSQRCACLHFEWPATESNSKIGKRQQAPAATRPGKYRLPRSLLIDHLQAFHPILEGTHLKLPTHEASVPLFISHVPPMCSRKGSA